MGPPVCGFHTGGKAMTTGSRRAIARVSEITGLLDNPEASTSIKFWSRTAFILKGWLSTAPPTAGGAHPAEQARTNAIRTPDCRSVRARNAFIQVSKRDNDHAVGT